MAACAVPAFAGSDGWTNCRLPTWRGANTLAIAPVSGHYDSDSREYVSKSATAYVNGLYNTSSMYLDIYQLKNGERVSQTITTGITGKSGAIIKYDYPVVRGLKLRLMGGNNFPSGDNASSTGRCDFG